MLIRFSSTGDRREIAPIAANMNMWVEKYKPQNIKQIIGQHGDASNVKKYVFCFLNTHYVL